MESFAPPCRDCGGKCCNYIAVELDKPTSKRDYDHIRWYLSHKNVNVFIDHYNKWHVEFRTPCEELTRNRECAVYESRPLICRNHGNSEGECEYYDTPYKEYFSTMTQFEKYLDEKKINWKFRFHIKGF